MSDKLHEYIRENRSAFDQLQPPDIWHGVMAGIKHSGLTFKPKNYKTMIKYGFGASAIVVASFVALHMSKIKQERTTPVTIQKVEKNERTIFDTTPSVVSAILPGKPVSASQVTRTPKSGTASETDAKAETPPVPPVPVVPASLTPPVAPAPPAAPLPPAAPSQPGKNSSTTFQQEIHDDDEPAGPEFVSLDSALTGINKIVVNAQVCNITVTTHKNDDVKVRGEIKEGGGDMLMLGLVSYKRREYKFKLSRNGDLLHVWVVDHKLDEKVKCKADSKIETFLNFEIPETTSLKVFNSSGNITVSGPLRSRAELKSSFGNITGDNIAAGLDVSTSSGNITISNTGGEVNSQSSFGNQKFDDISGNITLRSSSGGVVISNVKGNADITTSFGHQNLSGINGNIKLNSSSGDISVKKLTGNAIIKSAFGQQVLEFIEGDITSTSNSGDIRVADHKGQLSLKTSFGNIRGKNITLLNSSEFKATSGSITMNFTNKLEDLSFDLVSATGNLSIQKAEVKKKADKELHYGSGPITIKGVSNYGNQSYD